MGGLLCQSSYRDQRFRVVMGVGLNLSNREPTTCVDAAIEQLHRRLGLQGAPLPVPPEVRTGLGFRMYDLNIIINPKGLTLNPRGDRGIS